MEEDDEIEELEKGLIGGPKKSSQIPLEGLLSERDLDLDLLNTAKSLKSELLDMFKGTKKSKFTTAIERISNYLVDFEEAFDKHILNHESEHDKLNQKCNHLENILSSFKKELGNLSNRYVMREGLFSSYIAENKRKMEAVEKKMARTDKEIKEIYDRISRLEEKINVYEEEKVSALEEKAGAEKISIPIEEIGVLDSDLKKVQRAKYGELYTAIVSLKESYNGDATVRFLFEKKGKTLVEEVKSTSSGKQLVCEDSFMYPRGYKYIGTEVFGVR